MMTMQTIDFVMASTPCTIRKTMAMPNPRIRARIGKIEQGIREGRHEGHEEPGQPPHPVHDLPDVSYFLRRPGQYFDRGTDHAAGPRSDGDPARHRVFRLRLPLR